jgi:hypothetical protein
MVERYQAGPVESGKGGYHPGSMRRTVLLPSLALVLTLAACSSAERGPRPRASDQPSAIVSTPVPTTSAAAPPVSEDANCTLVMGFSVTENWFRSGRFELQPGIDDARWELLAPSGHDIELWADPAEPGWNEPVFSPCGRDPDRVVFQVAAKDWQTQSEDEVAALLVQSIDNIRAKWPTAGLIELIPIVGGPDAQPCPAGAGFVFASQMYPTMTEVIAGVANGQDILAGPDQLLADCSQYRDNRGHLTTAGSEYIASGLAQHFAR